MNLPARDLGIATDPQIAYKLGHRDARHAAAELAMSADAALDAAVAEERERCARLCRELYFKHGCGLTGLEYEAAIRAT